MLYWKDDVDFEYFKFCGDARYKPTGEQDSRHKKSPYPFRYLPVTPRPQELYASRMCGAHITTHQTKEGFMRHPSKAEALRHSDRTYPAVQKPA
ncbi:UNVERIFIED_CONTAM: hypothetical protein Sradi_2064300 [Sesamum radiatum]|uniref:Uncharacterized protein n=1 Tax=Sesamum radiatum TaxID=300843 RepID=A0AAW2TI59_SESRA